MQLPTTMDTVFFSLPPEIQLQALEHLSPGDLDHLFQLPALLYENRCDRYLIVRHQALVAKHSGKSLVVSNDPDLDTLSMPEIDYLIRHHIVISPCDITLALFDFTNYATSVAYMRTIFHEYLPALQNYTRNFRVRLILVENVPLDNSLLRSLFEPLRSGGFNVSWFSIKYLPGFGSQNFRDREAQVNVSELLQSGREIETDNLLLQLFSSSNLLKHLVNDNGCFYCDHLRTLDLSYNNLTEWHLRSLQFPSTLEHLNLSNNQLRRLCNLTFPHRNLTNLKSLDLSNNNIMQLNIRDYDTLCGPYSLQSINLSGNIISDYSGMFKSGFFRSLRTVDLSINLIENVSLFPESVTSIDLSGNYFALSFDSVRTVFPLGLQKLSIGVGTPYRTSNEALSKMMIKEAGLRELQELVICGRMGGFPYELY